MKSLLLAVLALFPLSVRADVALSVTNREAVARAQQPVSGGVPFARGTLTNTSRLRLLRGSAEFPAQFLPTAHWPDGSIRWVLVDTILDLGASATVPVVLDTDQGAAPLGGITFENSPATLIVNTGTARLTFSKNELPLELVIAGATHRAMPASWTIEESGPVKLVVRVDGSIGPASLRARLTFHRNRDDARVDVTIGNRGGFNWEGSRTRAADIVVSEARYGTTTLLPSGTYVFGPGVEKTWRIGRDVRFDANGSVASGWSAPQPLLVATPEHYASTRGWGVIAPVRNTGDAEVERFELLQRAKVLLSESETGSTVWSHLAQDLESWNDYGDLRWAGNGCGTLSGNHYDWSYGMYLQMMRSGRIEFADAARVFAEHEIDFDVYHTNEDGAAYNFQKNWEDRPSHDSPDNCFGGGRPTHTWTQGYALHWLLTGDRRGLDAFEELQEGIRQYLYESFVVEARVNTNELRTQGWLVDNLVARWRIAPDPSIAQTIQAVLTNVFEREAEAGERGFVYASPSGADEHSWDENLRAPLMNAYFLEPAIKAYDEIFRTTDQAYGARLFALIRRMTGFLMSVTYGGDFNASGDYRPLQIPYFIDVREPYREGQLPYLLMAANAAGFIYSETGDTRHRDYAQGAFRSYVRYVGAIPGDTYGDRASRTPASYESQVFVGTESKIHGWGNRYGQYFLAMEAPRGGRTRAVRR